MAGGQNWVSCVSIVISQEQKIILRAEVSRSTEQQPAANGYDLYKTLFTLVSVNPASDCSVIQVTMRDVFLLLSAMFKLTIARKHLLHLATDQEQVSRAGV